MTEEGRPSPDIEAARQALVRGDVAAGLSHASDALARAKSSGDLSIQAHAFDLLARAALRDARMPPQQALAHARQSAHLFHLAGDVRSESIALSQVAYLLTLQAYAEEAIESATLAVQLAETLPDGAHTAIAYNYLGVATLCRDSDYARRALLRSAELARVHVHAGAVTQPLINLLFNELHRLEMCRQTGQPAGVGAQAIETLEQLRELQRDGELRALAAEHDHTLAPLLLQVVETGLGAFLPAGSIPGLADLSERPIDSLEPHWLRALAAWLFARRALEDGRLERAQALIDHLLGAPDRLHHTRVLLIAHHMQVDLLERCGRPVEALAAFRAFRREQLGQECENMAARERIAALRLAWRQQSRALADLQVSTRRFEKLSLEDSLTGLANRRHLEHQVDAMLRQTEAEGDTALPWCLVMIDIDRFKQINDLHSHVVGDEVLRRMAQLLRHVLRQRDLAARLAGDEFVLILPDTDERGARPVVERLRGEIARHDWGAISPGLQVTASLGLAQARNGDTQATLMRRSDLQMYADKSLRRDDA